MGQDEVGVQGAGIRVARTCLDVCVTSPGDGSIPNARLGHHCLGIFAVLALDGDVGWLMLQHRAIFVKAA